MYTYCRIQWFDDKSELDVIIKSDYEIDDQDERIFFYGISPEKIQYAYKCGLLLQGEWKVVDIYRISDHLDEV